MNELDGAARAARHPARLPGPGAAGRGCGPAGTIDRGLDASIVPVLRSALEGHMRDVWEEAFRDHLRLLAVRGGLPVDEDVTAIGAWWDGTGRNEIDALALAGRSPRPVLAGEAKWSLSADATRLVNGLRRKVERRLGVDPEELRYAVCARGALERLPDGVVALTAADLFSAP